MQRKTIQDLTIKDSFMFGAVMLEPEICRRFLELCLEIPIAEVTVDREKCLVYHPEFHGVRLDVYAADQDRTYYNVEMQVRKSAIEKRARYYHSQMDMDFLRTAESFSNLPNSYVIFICDYDPFGEGKYRYQIKSVCTENPSMPYEDGVHTIILNTVGQDIMNTSPELVDFLKFVHSGTLSENDMQKDSLSRRMEESMIRIKADREMGAHFMSLSDMIQEEKEEMQLGDLRNIIDYLSIDEEKAMDILGVPEEKREKYRLELEKEPSNSVS